MRIWAALAAALLLGGCAAEMVEHRPRRESTVKEIGPIDAGGGHLRYSLRGPGFVVNARRRDAWDQMAAYCGGADRFKVVDEVARDEVEASFTADLEDAVSDGAKHYDKTTMQHVYFECLR